MRAPLGEHVEPWLDAYRTGELDAIRAGEVERHLAACPPCEARLDELRAFARTVERGFEAERVLAARAEPDWDRQRREILARTAERGVAARPAAGRASAGCSARRTFAPRYVPGLAMASVLVIVLGVLLREGVHGPADAERRLQEPATSEALAPDADRAAAPRGARPGPVGPEAPSPGSAAATPSQDAASRGPARERPTPAPAGFARAPDVPREGPGRTPEPPPSDELQERELRNEPFSRPGARDEVAAVDEDFSGEGMAQPADARRAPETARKAAPAVLRQTDARADGLPADESSAAAEPTRATTADGIGTGDSAALGVVPRRANEAPPPAEASRSGDLLQRLDLLARRALANGDSLETSRALSFWRDSVAGRDDLDPARKRAAAALVDSLASRPAAPE